MINNNLLTVKYDVNKLVFAEYNPRELTQDQHQDLKDSITRFGFVDPLIVNTHKERKNILVGGHQRLKIAKELGFKDVPCVEVNLTLDKEKELNVRLNKNTGQWDWDALANHFDVGELLEWGFSEDELQFSEPEEVKGLTDDDDVPEVEESITKQGDLWILGEHRLLCGDATKKEDVERLMDGQKADMVFTDPPYGVDYEGIANDNLKGEVYRDFLLSVWSLIDCNLGDGSNYYVWHSDSHAYEVIGSLRDVGWKQAKPSTIHWVKDSLVLSQGDYHSRSEPCLYGWKKGEGRCRVKDRKQDTIWEAGRPKKAEGHPTMKPIEICVRAIKNSSKDKYKIIDPFLGSGSTLIACEKTNRKCYGMEIDPHYCDVIVKRWEDYTGNKAERFEAANA